MLLLIEIQTHTLIEQTKPKPQETLEFKLNKEKDTIPFFPK